VFDPSQIQVRILKGRATPTGIPEKKMGAGTLPDKSGPLFPRRVKEGAGIKTEEQQSPDRDRPKEISASQHLYTFVIVFRYS
jgi:hypothetical protein